MTQMDLFKPAEEALAVTDDVNREIAKKAGGGILIPNIRIAQAAAANVQSGEATVGDLMVFGGPNLGKSVKVVIGPWRYHAIRFVNNNEVDLEDFNITPNSSFNAKTNDWLLPDGMTPNYREILDKVVPDSQSKPQISNCAGYDVLFWLPEHKIFALFLLAKTALSMTDTLTLAKLNRGSSAILSSQVLSSKSFSWQGPKLVLNPEGPYFDLPTDPKEATEVFNKFLAPGVMHDPESGETKSERPR